MESSQRIKRNCICDLWYKRVIFSPTKVARLIRKKIKYENMLKICLVGYLFLIILNVSNIHLS